MDINYRPLIFLYKHFRALVIGWIIAAGAVYILYFNNLPVFHKYPALMLLYCFIVIPLPYAAVPTYARTLRGRIGRILFDDCDPAPYIGVYEHIIAGFKDMNQPRMLPDLQTSLSSGLAAAGRYSEAYEILKQFSISGSGRAKDISRVVYHNNLISVCLKLGLTDEAEENLDLLIKAVAALRPRDYNKYKRFHLSAQYGVNIARGVYDYSEKAFAELFEASKSNCERAAAKFTLARIHLHYGDTPRAKEALEYVITHGNKLYIVDEAKELISKLRSDEPG